MNYLDKEEYDVKIDSHLLNYGTHNTYLKLTKQLKFSMKPPLDLKDMKLDYRSLTSKMVSAEFTQALEKELINLMSKNEDYLDLLDLTNLPDDKREKESIDRIINYLKYNNYDFVIVNGRWASFIQDTYSFNFNTSTNNSSVSSRIYHVGSILNVDVHVDPYMKYDTDWVICGRKNSFQYNLKFDSIVESPYSFSIVTNLNFCLGYDIDMSNNFIRLHFLYKNNEAYSKFISDIRDKKIDEIIK